MCLQVPAALQFAIRKLIENASQAAETVPAPGHLPQVTLRAFRDGARRIIEVEQNGPGLPPQIRARAFDPLVTTKAWGGRVGPDPADGRGAAAWWRRLGGTDRAGWHRHAFQHRAGSFRMTDPRRVLAALTG